MPDLTGPSCQSAGYVDGAVLTSNVANQHKAGPAASFDTQWEVSTACNIPGQGLVWIMLDVNFSSCWLIP